MASCCDDMTAANVSAKKKQKINHPQQGDSSDVKDGSTVDHFPADQTSDICTQIEALPNEILTKIFGYLDVIRKHRSRRVCRRWRTVLLSPPVIRAMTVDQAYYVTDGLGYRYIPYEVCVRHALSPTLVQLRLSGSTEQFLVGGASTREPLLNTAISAMLRDCRTESSPAVRLTVVHLENGSVGMDAFLGLFVSYGDEHRSFRRATLRDVTVQGLRVSHVTLPVYGYSLALPEGVLGFDEDIDYVSQLDVAAAFWELMGNVCPVVTPERILKMKERITSLAADVPGQCKVMRIIKTREPSALEKMQDVRDIERLQPLTLTDLAAYLTSVFGIEH